MIDKLRKRIFWIIQISLSIVIISVVIIFVRFSYKNAVTSSTIFMDRASGKTAIRVDKPKDIEENQPNEPQRIDEPYSVSVDGVYKFLIKDNNIMRESSNNVTDDIRNKAIEVSTKESEEGLIEKYIYKIRKIGNGEIEVILMENENAINRLRATIIWTCIVGIIGILIIAIIAKKITKTIVKPVEDSFEKQKQFISDASHELKTPLAVIEANADVLSNKIGESKWITYIQNEVQSMDKLVNDLLVLAKMENTQNSCYKNFDLSKEVQMTVSVFESMTYEKKINLETDIKDSIGFVGEKEDIKQIISILLDNAIKHTCEGDKIMVSVSKEKGDIEIEVKNQGEPIPEDEKSKIFERFYRVDKARNRSEKRYGLGLSIAKGIVDKYNGTIEVNCKDGFTSFIVKLNSK